MSKAVKEKFEKNELWDIKVSFKNPQMIFILNRLDGIPGVKSVEPYTLSDAEIVYKNRSTLGY